MTETGCDCAYDAETINASPFAVQNAMSPPSMAFELNS